MKRIRSLLLLLLLPALLPPGASAQAFEELLSACGGREVPVPGLPVVPPAGAEGFGEAGQYLPPDNNEPGFEWRTSRSGEHFFYIGTNSTYLKSGPGQASDLADGTGRCQLGPNTLYKASAKPGFEGEHMTVQLAEPLPGCSLSRGFVYMEHVSSSSAGGAWELPRNVRAFLDTLAFAEGTGERYNYIFTHAVFNSYADHPRIKKCAGRLCSTAAGRYQFL